MTTNQWVRLDDVPATIGDFLDQVGHEALRIDVGHSTLHVTRDREGFEVVYYGEGGGYYATREMRRYTLVRYVESQNAPVRLRRPESQRPIEEAIA